VTAAQLGQGAIDLDEARAHLADLAPRGQEALDGAAALHERAAHRLARGGHERHVAVPLGERDGLFEGPDHHGIGERRAHGRGVGAGDADAVAQQPRRAPA